MRFYAVILVVGVGTLLSAMAGSTINVALPDLGRDLHISIGQSRWVIQVMLVSTGLMMIPAGRLGDRFGYKRLYLVGFSLFAAASVACGMATSLLWLLAFRVLQGLGGSLVMANAPALLTTSCSESMRGKALGIAATATYTGLTLGPPVGGFIVERLGWQWTFFINLPVAVVVLIMGSLCLPDNPGHGRSAFFSLFKSRQLVLSFVSAISNYIALFSIILMVPFFLQEGLGLTPSRVGALLMATPLLMALVASPSGWVSDKVGTKWLAVLGLAVLVAGCLGVSSLDAQSSQGEVIFWLSVCGLGTGIFISPNSSALMGAAPRKLQGAAGSIMATARVLGVFCGVLLVSSVFQWAGGNTGTQWRQEDFDAFSLAIGVTGGVAVVGILASYMRRK